MALAAELLILGASNQHPWDQNVSLIAFEVLMTYFYNPEDNHLQNVSSLRQFSAMSLINNAVFYT